jgi:hypothetical protein
VGVAVGAAVAAFAVRVDGRLGGCPATMRTEHRPGWSRVAKDGVPNE